jgi:hypothetical protein
MNDGEAFLIQETPVVWAMLNCAFSFVIDLEADDFSQGSTKTGMCIESLSLLLATCESWPFYRSPVCQGSPSCYLQTHKKSDLRATDLE